MDYVNCKNLLNVLNDDAYKWAEAFKQIIVDRGKPIDIDILVAWFANAIEHSNDFRRWKREKCEQEEIGKIVEWLKQNNFPTDFDNWTIAQKVLFKLKCPMY